MCALVTLIRVALSALNKTPQMSFKTGGVLTLTRGWNVIKLIYIQGE
jgi:hypothetical protein